ncbi:MAG: thiamine pyrophosphate-dependent enzyme, partial [Pseudomonadota bacterium]
RCEALEEVVRFAELIGAKVYQGWMSDVNFPVTHPQYLGDMDPTGPQAAQLFNDADLLIGIGCPMFDQGFYGPEMPLPESLRVIQIDENPWEIGKNMPVDCGIHGDIKAALTELNESIGKKMPPPAREGVLKRIQEIADEKSRIDSQLNKQIEEEKDHVPIAIPRLMAEIRESITEDTIVVDDCWSSSGMLRSILDLSRPGRFFRARRGGSIGWGLPGALGVKLGAPERPVIAVSGDGSAAWSMQTFWTAARYHIPVTFVLTNNATYRQVKLVRKRILGDYPLNERHEGMELDEPVMDFCLLAQSMGVPGSKVVNPEDLGPALKTAMGSGGPHLVEVFVENKP